MLQHASPLNMFFLFYDTANHTFGLLRVRFAKCVWRQQEHDLNL